MKVRISHNLTKTDNKWTVTKEMRKMKGKIYEVKNIRPIINSVYIEFWYFCAEDVNHVKMTPP